MRLYTYSKEGIGRIFRISKYFLQVVHRCGAQPINVIWCQLPYFFPDMDDWFRDEKKPSDTVCILPDAKPLISLSKENCSKLTCCERESGFMDVKVETVSKA
jgi:hypothetical protein